MEVSQLIFLKMSHVICSEISDIQGMHFLYVIRIIQIKNSL